MYCVERISFVVLYRKMIDTDFVVCIRGVFRLQSVVKIKLVEYQTKFALQKKTINYIY